MKTKAIDNKIDSRFKLESQATVREKKILSKLRGGNVIVPSTVKTGI